MAEANEELDLIISRLLRAPRSRVWQAWADPEHLKQWWCPKPWTTEVRAFDLKAGGAFHTTMRGPDGGVSDNPGSFLHVLPMERVVFTSLMTGGGVQRRPGCPLPPSSPWRMRARARATPPMSCTRTRLGETAMKKWDSSMAGTVASPSLMIMP